MEINIDLEQFAWVLADIELRNLSFDKCIYCPHLGDCRGSTALDCARNILEEMRLRDECN